VVVEFGVVLQWQGASGGGLPGAGEAWLHGGSDGSVAGDQFVEHRLDHRPRPDDAHRAGDDVEHLGQFIEVRRAQEVAPAFDVVQAELLLDLPVREAGGQAADLDH